jgi:hypothetical protein
LGFSADIGQAGGLSREDYIYVHQLQFGLYRGVAQLGVLVAASHPEVDGGRGGGCARVRGGRTGCRARSTASFQDTVDQLATDLPRATIFRAKQINGDVDSVVAKARQIHDRKRPVLIEAVMDLSFRTFFTRGAVRTNFGRLPWSERVHFVTRALDRQLPGQPS